MVCPSVSYPCNRNVNDEETSTTKTVFLWYRFQRDVNIFLKFRMTSTLKKILKEEFLSRFSIYRQKLINGCNTRVTHYVLQCGFSTTLTTSLSSPVFRKKPSSVCIHLTILSNQLSMTPDHVDWGMSKMTPSMNARASSTFLNCFPFSCLLTEGNKNQSQGVRSGEYGGRVTMLYQLSINGG